MDQVCDWNNDLANQFMYENIVAKYVPVLMGNLYENFG